MSLWVLLWGCGPAQVGIAEPESTDAPSTPGDPGVDPPGPTDPGTTDPGTPGDSGGDCALSVPASPYHLTLQHEGITRTAVVDLPSDYDGTTAVPMVFNFHGLSTTADMHRSYTGMHTAANARGWIAVHPDGTNRSWDYLSDSRDIRFIDALLTELSTVLCLDETRVYASGLSNGGYFSYQLACDYGDRFAAIAPVAAGDLTFDCNPGVMVPLLHIHGTSDNVVPYDGSLILPSARESVSGWAEGVNHCEVEPVVAFQSGAVTCETWACTEADEATLCTAQGAGHTWPGAFPIPLLGSTNNDIDATEEILDFLSRYTR